MRAGGAADRQCICLRCCSSKMHEGSLLHQNLWGPVTALLSCPLDCGFWRCCAGSECSSPYEATHVKDAIEILALTARNQVSRGMEYIRNQWFSAKRPGKLNCSKDRKFCSQQRERNSILVSSETEQTVNGPNDLHQSQGKQAKWKKPKIPKCYVLYNVTFIFS